MLRFFLLAIVFWIIPFVGFADLEISEIMYDYEGTDTGFEWIEIYNNGSSDIPIETFHLFEADVHHGLFPDGFGSLAAGSRALIVQNIDNVRGLYGSSIALIKSSFSLNNTGEPIALSNEAKEIITSEQYTSDDGAAGNGFSLQKNNGGWIQATPTPAAVNASEGEEASEEEDSGSSKESSQSRQKKSEQNKETTIDYYQGSLDITSQIVASVPVSFEAYVEHHEGNKIRKKIKGGQYSISFGDGSSRSSDTRFESSHIYEYPGKYRMIFEFYSSRLKEENKEEPTITISKDINVIAANIIINSVDSKKGIDLENKSGQDINLGGWSLRTKNDSYTFPKNSILLKNSHMTVPLNIHQLGNITRAKDVWLVNNQGITVSSNIKKSSRVSSKATTDPAPHVSQKDAENFGEPTSETIPSLERFLSQHPEKEPALFNDIKDPTKGLSSSRSKGSIPLGIIFGFGLLALALIVVRNAYSPRNKEEEITSEFEPEIIGEIELIE